MPKHFANRINEQIRISPVLVIKNGTPLGTLPTDKAINLAREEGLDLVEVSPQARPPVCIITDYGKYRYEQTIKDKKQKKNKSNQIKQVRLSPSISQHDLETKLRMAKKFLESGIKVQLHLEYKKREAAHKELGIQTIKAIVEQLSDVAVVKSPARIEGKHCTCMLEPKTT